MGKYKQSYKKGSKRYNENQNSNYINEGGKMYRSVEKIPVEEQFQKTMFDAISVAQTGKPVDVSQKNGRNRYPSELIPEEINNHNDKSIYDSRKAAYHEKSHNYDLNAFATLVSSGKTKEEAIETLEYFYQNIDRLHVNEPKFRKNQVSNSNRNTRVGRTNNTYMRSDNNYRGNSDNGSYRI